MNKTLYVTIIIIIIIFNIYLHFVIKNITRINNFLIGENDFYKNSKNIVLQNRVLEYKAEQFSLRNKNEYFTDYKNKYVVFRFIDNTCHQCVDSTINYAINLKKIIGEKNIIICVKENENLKLTTIKRMLQFEFSNIVNIPTNLTPIDEYDKSYFFISDSSLRVSHIIIPNVQFSQNTIEYFKVISSKFFNK